MAQLALLAMLLMSIAPTISRALQAGSGPVGSALVAAQMCTMAGLQTKLFDILLPGAAGNQGKVDSTGSHPANADNACGDCGMPTLIPALINCSLPGLEAGDGVRLRSQETLQLSAGKDAGVLVFDRRPRELQQMQ